MAYRNQFAALRLLEAGADKAACDLIQDSDKSRHSDVMEAVSGVGRNRHVNVVLADASLVSSCFPVGCFFPFVKRTFPEPRLPDVLPHVSELAPLKGLS